VWAEWWKNYFFKQLKKRKPNGYIRGTVTSKIWSSLAQHEIHYKDLNTLIEGKSPISRRRNARWKWPPAGQFHVQFCHILLALCKIDFVVGFLETFQHRLIYHMAHLLFKIFWRLVKMAAFKMAVTVVIPSSISPPVQYALIAICFQYM